MDSSEISAKLDSLIEINRDIQQWLKILAWDRASIVVEQALGDRAEEYHLYEELDGETSIGKIIEEVQIPRRTAYNRLSEWQRIGIVTKVGRGKYEKIASLDSLGIEPPDSGE